MQVYSYCRQIPGCYSDVSDIFIGTKGRADILKHTIEGENPWRYSGPKPGMYDVEHQKLFAAIRSGKTINNGVYLARSTMWAILGRMVDYTGEALAWDRAINSTQRLAPAKYAFDATPPILPDKDGKYPIAVPGETKIP